MDIMESTYCDYMMLVSPPADVKEKVRKLKLASARVIGDYDGMHSLAHMSVTGQTRIAPVKMYEKLEFYQKKLIRIKAKYVHVKGFNYFMHGSVSATIYLRVEISAELTEWLMQIKQVFGDKQRFVPHITIVKNIPIEQFRKLWPYFADRTFNEYFLADKLTVLARPTFGNETDRWAPFKEVYFKK